MGWTLRKRVVAAAAGAAAFAGAPAGLVIGTAAPAAAQTLVSTEAELRTAFDTDSSIQLANDIELSDCNGAGALTRSAAAPVSLNGAGFTVTQTCADNVFELDQSDVTLENVTVTGGREPDDGGAIDMNGGDLTVIRSTLVRNCAADSAGAIENEDNDTTIIGSTLTGNVADDQAGAVRSKRGSTVIVNSTVTGNTQTQAGAVDSGQQDSVEASLTLVYNTIVHNTNDSSASCDAGVRSEAETDADGSGDVGATQVNPANVNAVDAFASFGTVVALPIGGPNCDIGSPGSGGFNFSDDDTCEFTNTAQGDRENAGDPGLAALASNGGPTQTRLPLAGSPLINFIPIPDCGGGDDLAGFAVTTDQRGVSRPQETGCEIGSVEIEAPVPPGPAPAPAAVPAEPRFTG